MDTEGLFGYLSNFVIQFFYYPILGSGILSVILSTLFLFLYKVIFKLVGVRDICFVSIIPSLYFFIQTISPDYPLSNLIATWIVLFVLYIASFFINKPLFEFFSKLKSLKYSFLISFVFLILYSSISFYLFINKYNIGEYRMILVDKAVKDKDWNTVLSITDDFFKKGTENQLMFYFRNLALYNKGILLDGLLKYNNRLGVKSLYFPWKSDSRETEYGHYIYEELGYINEAHRWAFEAMVVWGLTAQHVTNLAKYNIVLERQDIANKFINILESTLFYKDVACDLRSGLNDGKVLGLKVAKQSDLNIRFTNVMNIGPELDYLCSNDPENRMALEYLVADLLLSNNVVRLIDVLNKYRDYINDNLINSNIVQQALFIYKLGVGNEIFKETRLFLLPAVESSFERYYQLYKSGNQKQLKEEFGDSYWYYLHFLSPYGSKIINN